ncbi:MAG: T9SS type A sorting domain-containing protein [Bacteroidales bacterium]|jgi:hypothetical protein|nr:T9SS type A sorting domain-containing protein [Bacteroidales bacterium]
MKTKILCISFVCCFALQANAQTTNTIVNENSAWSTCVTLDTEVGRSRTDYCFFDGDSVFNEKTYKKLFCYRDKEHSERFFEGLMREENKKTYFFPSYWDSHREEVLLYDFSLEQGDMFEYPNRVFTYIDINGDINIDIPKETVYVLQSDSVLVNNKLKKRLIVGSGWILDTIVENIGRFTGLYPVRSVVSLLLCYHQNNELVYKNPYFSECYDAYPTFAQTIKANNCIVFPNPVGDILHMSCLNNAIMRIEIFDNTGRQVYSQTYKDTIDVSSFTKGLYIFKLYDVNGEVSEFKFIK